MPLTCGLGISALLVVSCLIKLSCALKVPSVRGQGASSAEIVECALSVVSGLCQATQAPPARGSAAFRL